MSDSERPNAAVPSFEIPDLELEPVPRSLRQAAPPREPAPPTKAATLASPTASPLDRMFGSSIDFGDDLGDFELERTAQPNAQIATRPASRASATEQTPPPFTPSKPIPSGRAPDVAKLEFDPREVAILADYGEPPDTAALTPAYAYRVFTRQRELKHRLAPLDSESQRAESEREGTLAEFSRAVRPAIEQISEFRRFLAPLLEVEQRAAARGQALNSINAQLGAHNAELDAELATVKSQLEAAQRAEREAHQVHEEREANAKRAEAKLKRLQIEMRAVSQVAEQKLGPAGGPMPALEASQLSDLEQRAHAMQPEVEAARARFDQAKLALGRARTDLATLAQSERQIGRKRQAVDGAFEKELTARSHGVSEAEIEQRLALADLARAVLAAPGTIAFPEEWLERVRSVSEHADQLLVRREMLARAIASYDVARARQGVRLAATAIGISLMLFVFKLIF